MKHTHALAAAAFAVFGFGAVSAQAAVIDVTAASPDGWGFFNNDNAGINASGGFVVGPSVPPIGTGSAQLLVGDATSSEILRQVLPGPLTLSTVTSLSYATYVTTSTQGSGSAATLQFDLFQGATYEGRLVFDPGLLGPVTDNSWQTWDTLSDTAWYFSRPALVTADGGNCSIGGNYCSFSAAATFLGTQGITAATNLFKAGSGQSSFNGNVDAYTINTTTYNFDATAVPEPLTMSVFGVGLVGAVAARRRKSKKN